MRNIFRMEICKVCGKKIFFWNKFKRKYGIPKAIINKNFKNPIDFPMCSMKCFSRQSNCKYVLKNQHNTTIPPTQNKLKQTPNIQNAN